MHPAPAVVIADDTTDRILDSALAQYETWGVRRTTVEDVARRAGVSRVTIYRRFGNREGLAQAVLLREENRFFGELGRALERYRSPVSMLAEGFAFTLPYLRRHSLLNRLIASEPDVILPYLTTRAGPALATARRYIAAGLRQSPRIAGRRARWNLAEAEVLAEVFSRMLLSFLLTPETVANLETGDDARRFARRYLAPILSAGAAR
ncbi:MAG TPA: TetR family transcriptional regulator [Candidatus Dormibacteraeota bacterium]|nr:TetR family transcriptional regulator [Candidatus Dormibacteraeota bacterium]